jgi:spore coat polysaccharide biosynthesis protein SpsF (cytidylyltransferase family)
MSNVLCVIQARMNSRRLPGKMLMKVGGETLIEIAWRKACEAFGEENVVVAIPSIIVLAESKNFFFTRIPGESVFSYWGREGDVLGRFYEAAKECFATPGTIIFRYTPDDYRKDVDAMRRVAQGEKGIPVEIGGEAFTFAQLREWHETVTDPFLREHIGHLITPSPVSPPDDGLPWSIDTADDLRRANVSPRIPAFTQGSMEFARGLE